jgi:hypothetical protein
VRAVQRVMSGCPFLVQCLPNKCPSPKGVSHILGRPGGIGGTPLRLRSPAVLPALEPAAWGLHRHAQVAGGPGCRPVLGRTGQGTTTACAAKRPRRGCAAGAGRCTVPARGSLPSWAGQAPTPPGLRHYASKKLGRTPSPKNLLKARGKWSIMGNVFITWCSDGIKLWFLI